MLHFYVNHYFPLNTQCYRQWLFRATLYITLKIKTWVVAYFFNFFKLREMKKNAKVILCNFSMRMLKCFQENFKKNFALKK